MNALFLLLLFSSDPFEPHWSAYMTSSDPFKVTGDPFAPANEIKPKPLTAYDRAFARVLSGESLLVYAGVKKPAVIAGTWVDGIPEKRPGIYRWYLDRGEPTMLRLSPKSEAPSHHRPFSSADTTTTIARTRHAVSDWTEPARFTRKPTLAAPVQFEERTPTPALTARRHGSIERGCPAGG